MSQDSDDTLELAIDPAEERRVHEREQEPFGTRDSVDLLETTRVDPPLGAQGDPDLADHAGPPPVGLPDPAPAGHAGATPVLPAGAAPAARAGGPHTGSGTAVQSFRIGEVLSQSMPVYIQRLIPFSIISMVVYVLPVVLLGLIVQSTMDPPSPAMEEGAAVAAEQAATVPTAMLVWGVLFMFVLTASGLFVCAIVTGTTFRQMRGEPADLRQMIRMGLGRMPRLLALWGILLLAGVGFSISAALLIALLGVLGILVLIGVLVLILVLWCRWWVLLPVAVVEEIPIMQCFQRSAFLTEGYRGQIFGLALMLWVIGGAISLLFGGATDAFGMILSATFQMAYGNFFLVVLAVSYHELRLSKEDVELGDLVRVFS